MSIVTLDIAKQWLQISHTAQDDVIQLMIDGAESFLAEYLGVVFGANNFQDDLDSQISNQFQTQLALDVLRPGNGAAFLAPKKRPVTAVASVLDLQNGNAAQTFKLVGDLIAFADSDGNELGAWPPGLGRFRVSYTAGWSTVTIPSAVKTAVCILVSKIYNSRGIQMGPDLMDDVLIRMVQPHSRRRVAGV